VPLAVGDAFWGGFGLAVHFVSDGAGVIGPRADETPLGDGGFVDEREFGGVRAVFVFEGGEKARNSSRDSPSMRMALRGCRGGCCCGRSDRALQGFWGRWI